MPRRELKDRLPHDAAPRCAEHTLGRFKGWNAVRDGLYINFLQKESHVYQRVNGRWALVQLHYSAPVQPQ